MCVFLNSRHTEERPIKAQRLHTHSHKANGPFCSSVQIRISPRKLSTIASEKYKLILKEAVQPVSLGFSPTACLVKKTLFQNMPQKDCFLIPQDTRRLGLWKPGIRFCFQNSSKNVHHWFPELFQNQDYYCYLKHLNKTDINWIKKKNNLENKSK